MQERDPPLANRRRVELDNGSMWLAPPEYVIVRKLEYLREGGQDKHVRDLRFMLAATPVNLIWIESAVERLGFARSGSAARRSFDPSRSDAKPQVKDSGPATKLSAMKSTKARTRADICRRCG